MTDSTESAPERSPSSRSDLLAGQAGCQAGNIAVPIGALLIIASFFLPWLEFESSTPSGFDIAFRTASARKFLDHFGVPTPEPTKITRRLVLVPLMAAGVLLLNLTTGASVQSGQTPSTHSAKTHVVTRTFARILIFATGVFLTVVLGYVGSMFTQLKPAPAFWTTFSGGLLIAVGSFFDILRRT